ncbi:hypothetical protein RLEG3_31825 [Rhizobium leguminosarum bv. trifolii WSM1689]|nr:hypothetical protein RLEG3_31825 [Rhizobium leguminosarum bv. trifolii WSM1689]
MDTLGKIQVKRHAAPPGELVWAVEMTKCGHLVPAMQELFDFQKNERRMIG